MKLLEHTKYSDKYLVRIWMDETKFDLQGNPYEEWVHAQTWGLEVPMNTIEDGKDEYGKPKYKQVPAMTQPEYEKSQLEEAIRQAKEKLELLTSNSQQVTAPKSL